jgi:hypothetical protein
MLRPARAVKGINSCLVRKGLGMALDPRGQSSPATETLHLNGRTLNRTVRAEYTTISRLGPQQRRATDAFIEKLADINGHGVGSRKPAARTDQYRLKNDRLIRHHSNRIPRIYTDPRISKNGLFCRGFLFVSECSTVWTESEPPPVGYPTAVRIERGRPDFPNFPTAQIACTPW